ncbi:N-acylneuraminate cytidylyltransferase [Cyclonatronum proteinivorum]|uniref:N-acylneuraminate cytidylyltransferase n=1 Tax=Cyclonatronum proteinivorum TaxID=1457365 RepID=A0A345UMH5_9BACT|nr:acylneuraminate cytidylyltransferase [Cyclonatronum proteinivorum]AXJ01677.1 N-acylneuraminate cytidylyltransferase [Cyclonatronum proteinivorum]
METFLKDELTIIIPVREGSTRVKDKIYLEIEDGVSLLEWKVSEIFNYRKDLKVLISSNSENVKAIAKNLGVGYHERDPYLCTGHVASFSEVITGIVKDIGTKHFAWCTVVVPYMSKSMFQQCFEDYFNHVVNTDRHDSLVSVNLIKEYLWLDDKPLNYQADKNHTISQELPNIFKVTNGLYMRDKLSTIRDGYFLGAKPFKTILPKVAGIDIDEFEDYEFAKAMLPIYKERYK